MQNIKFCKHTITKWNTNLNIFTPSSNKMVLEHSEQQTTAKLILAFNCIVINFLDDVFFEYFNLKCLVPYLDPFAIVRPRITVRSRNMPRILKRYFSWRINLGLNLCPNSNLHHLFQFFCNTWKVKKFYIKYN